MRGIAFFVSTWVLAAGEVVVRAEPAPVSPDALVKAVDAAVDARDLAALRRLVHTEGATRDDLAEIEKRLGELIASETESTVSLDRLPEGGDFVRIHDGKRIEPTLEPTGFVRIASRAGRASIVSTILYGKSEGGYRLAGMRSVDLGWKGPPDRRLVVRVNGLRGRCSFRVRYNVSGVDRVDTYSTGMVTFSGQRVDAVEVTGLSDDFAGRLVVQEGESEVFRSEPLGGVVNFKYARAEP